MGADGSWITELPYTVVLTVLPICQNTCATMLNGSIQEQVDEKPDGKRANQVQQKT